MIGYAISSSGGPYPLFALSFVFNGIGFGFQVRQYKLLQSGADCQDAQINALTARLPNPNAKMSLLHSFFGLGGTIAPFISTPFVQHHAQRPYLLYTLCLAVAVITLAVEIVVFRGQTEEQLTGRKDRSEAEKRASEAGEALPVPLPEVGATEARVASQSEARMESGEEVVAASNGSGAKMRTILTTPAAYVFVLHAFLYVSCIGFFMVMLMHRSGWRRPLVPGP